MELQPREMRRQFGLSQMQLSDLLGVTQSTISRWEKGVELIKHSKKLELLDLFSNRGGKLDPLVKYLFSKAKNLSAFDFNLNCHSAAEVLLRSAQMERSDVVGQNYSQLCESEWFSKVYGNVPMSERLYYEYEHLLTTRGQKIWSMPIRARQYFVQFEDTPGLMLSLVEEIPPIDRPRVLERQTTELLDTS